MAHCKYAEICPAVNKSPSGQMYCPENFRKKNVSPFYVTDGERSFVIRDGCSNFEHRYYEVNRRKTVEVLLSKGWKLSFRPVGEVKSLSDMDRIQDRRVRQSGQSSPKETDKVAEATLKTSDQVHGGDNASKEVLDSPNAAENGMEEKNSQAIGEKNEGGDENANSFSSSSDISSSETSSVNEEAEKINKFIDQLLEEGEKEEKQKNGRPGGGNASYSPPKIKGLGKEDLFWAEKSAEILAQMIGKGTPPVEEEGVDWFNVVRALEVGEDVSPYFYVDRETENAVKVLVTPDFSGSTVDWSPNAAAFCRALEKKKDKIEIFFVPNFNGEIQWEDSFPPDLKDFDFVLYLGDEDGYECMKLISKEVKVISLSNAYSSYRNPFITEKEKNFLWVQGVAGKDPRDIVNGLKLALHNM